MLQGSQEWLDLRACHAATCSEYGTAIGVGYKSRQKYWRVKMGIDAADPCNWRMAEGNRREPFIAELYWHIMRMCGHNVHLHTDAFREDVDDHRFGGSVDRIVTDDTGDKWVLEIKSRPEGEGFRDEIPETHLLQMLGLCHAYGLSKAHYICSTYGTTVFLAEVHFNPGFWELHIYPRLREFGWYWGLRREPPRMKSADKLQLLKLIHENCIVTPIPAVQNTMHPPQ